MGRRVCERRKRERERGGEDGSINVYIPQTRCPKHRGLRNATRIYFPEGSK